MKVKINDIEVEVSEGETILSACRKLNIEIPTLCYLPLHLAHERNNKASCRVCVVEVKGKKNLIPSCSTPCQEGMEIYTNTLRVINARKTIIELLLSDHPNDCTKCDKNMHCKLQSVAYKMGITEIPYEGELSKPDEYTTRSISIRRNPSKCILCEACVTVCNKVQKMGILQPVKRGFKTDIGPAYNLTLDQTDCSYCGQCVSVCPTGAIVQTLNINDVWNVLSDKSKHVIVEVAPAVRSSIGEEFNYPLGTLLTGKIPTALRALGFKHVFDTNFGADLTIVEEAHELLTRLKEHKNLPLITSCCPGWINLLEKRYPEFLDNVSSCKSPHEMFGAIVKSYYAEKMGYKKEDIVVVSIMPCLAKKDEINREELKNFGLKDVDYVITTREFAQMIKLAGINFDGLEESKFDDLLGESTGGADIFASAGGVMESAIRSAKYMVGEKTNLLEIEDLRGLKGIKEAKVKIGEHILKVCAVSGLGNAQDVLDDLKINRSKYDFIEIMACPGGCVNGAGQPYRDSKMSVTITKARSEGMYTQDRKKDVRVSVENKSIEKLYHDYLGSIGGEKAHNLLHTTYKNRKK